MPSYSIFEILTLLSLSIFIQIFEQMNIFLNICKKQSSTNLFNLLTSSYYYYIDIKGKIEILSKKLASSRHWNGTFWNQANESDKHIPSLWREICEVKANMLIKCGKLVSFVWPCRWSTSLTARIAVKGDA